MNALKQPAFGSPRHWINGRGQTVQTTSMDDDYLINTLCFVARHVCLAMTGEPFDDGPILAHMIVRVRLHWAAALGKLLELARELRRRKPGALPEPVQHLLEGVQ